jgi:hypothetical protein
MEKSYDDIIDFYKSGKTKVPYDVSKPIYSLVEII